METRLLKLVEDRFSSVRKLLSSESKQRYESIELLKSSLENDLPKLQDLIQTETDQREVKDNALFQKIDQEVRGCIDTIE